MKLVNYWDKYTEMHGQQKGKIQIKILRFIQVGGGKVTGLE